MSIMWVDQPVYPRGDSSGFPVCMFCDGNVARTNSIWLGGVRFGWLACPKCWRKATIPERLAACRKKCQLDPSSKPYWSDMAAAAWSGEMREQGVDV